MDEKGAPPDAEVAAIATRQHGVVSIGQLREAGLSDTAVSVRARLGRLHRVHRGVYAVGHRALTFEGRCMAVVLAVQGASADRRAVISHRSAAALWRMLPAHPGPVEVSINSRSGRRERCGIRLHRPRSLPLEHLTHLRRISVTTPARTVSDLRRAIGPAELRRAIRQGEVLGLQLEGVVHDGTRSELEHAFLRLCHRHRLPMPEVNVPIGDRIADFLWRERRLIVEADGYRYHRGRAAFEDDRARDLELRALGFEVLRLSHRQVTAEPKRVASVLREALRGRVARLIPDMDG